MKPTEEEESLMPTKQCTNSECKQNNPQPLTSFSKDKSRKDGLQIRCKACNLTYALEHKEQKAATRAVWYEKNKAEVAANVDKEWRDAYMAIYRREKAEEIRLQRISYREPRKEITATYNAAYTKANPDIMNAKGAKRRAARLNATPPWLTYEQNRQNEEFYIIVKEIQWLSEEYLHVDHIVPLQGENISGLHVPWNLQILTEKANISKSNKFDQIEYDRIDLPILIKSFNSNLRR
jgi:5-methylcytosine-specific restriction endonuclease McrA